MGPGSLAGLWVFSVGMLQVSILGLTAAKTEKTALLKGVGQTDRQTHRQTDKQKHKDRQTDRQTDRRVLTTVSPVCRSDGGHNDHHDDLRDRHGFLQKPGLFLCLSLSLFLSLMYHCDKEVNVRSLFLSS